MSAFICDPEHIGKLAKFGQECDPYTFETAMEAAESMARANLKSVAYRYDDMTEDTAAKEFGFDCEDAEAYVRACVAASWGASGLEPVEALKLAQSVDYQSCEPPTWEGSHARQTVQRIEGAAIAKLPGYQEAKWSL